MSLGVVFAVVSRSREAVPPSGFLPEHPILASLPRIEVVEGSVKKNTTLVATLVDLDVPVELAHRVATLIQPVFDLRGFRSGNGFRLEKETNGTLRAFEYKIDDDKVLEVQRAADSYAARVATLDLETRDTTVAVEITSSRNSLYAALSDQPRRDDLARKVADIFAWDVDFNSDLQVADSIHVVVPALYHEGQFVKWGKIQAAELVNSRKAYRAFLFMDSYYDGRGNALKRSLLASPLPFNPRISSGFSRRRLHPILGTNRPHLAVDYAAPTGTSVQAVANGTIVFAGWNEGYGNLVQIKHTGGLTTGYAHLSRISPGVRAGRAVGQGDIIGAVGQTGLATGPHLHYMMTRNGAAINPMTMKSEPPVPIDAKLRPAFEAQIAPLASRLAPSASAAR